MPRTQYPYLAHITFPDGTTRSFDRWGDGATFAVVGRDRVGLRRDEPLFVAEWRSGLEEYAQEEAARWLAGYGGEWFVVPVTYTSPGNPIP
jgi:hypothetical protein